MMEKTDSGATRIDEMGIQFKKKYRKKTCHRQFFVSQFVTVLSTVTLSRTGEPMGAKVKRVQVSLVKQYK